MWVWVEILIKKNYSLSCYNIGNYVDLVVLNAVYYFPDSLNHIEHIIYPPTDYIYINILFYVLHSDMGTEIY